MSETHYHVTEGRIIWQAGIGATIVHLANRTGPVTEAEAVRLLEARFDGLRPAVKQHAMICNPRGESSRYFVTNGTTVSVVQCVRSPCPRPVTPWVDTESEEVLFYGKNE